MPRSPRPSFLNLTQIQMPVGALTSIGHRITGILIAAGIPIGVYLLDLSLQNEQAFAEVMGLFTSGAVKGVGGDPRLGARAPHAGRSPAFVERLQRGFAVAPGAPQCVAGESGRSDRGPVCSRGLAVKFKFTGLAAWWVQRASAVYMLLFVVFLLGSFVTPSASFLPRVEGLGRQRRRVHCRLRLLRGAAVAHVGWPARCAARLRTAGRLCAIFLLGMLSVGLLGTAAWVLWILVRLQA